MGPWPGACLLGLYFGRGAAEEPQRPANTVVQALVSWFHDEYGQQYGGIRQDILAGGIMAARCPGIVVEPIKRCRNCAQAEAESGDDETL